MKILIIGLGSIARKHVAAIREIDRNAEIYALRRQTDAAEFESVINIFSLDEITFPLNFVIISNPTAQHGEAIKSVIDFGCPLFIEKPVFHQLNGTAALMAEIAERKIVTYVACNLRFHACLVYLKNYLTENDFRLNEVNSYCGSYLPDWRPNVDFRQIYSANKELGGGVHLDLIHELDYIYWLFGAPQKVNAVQRSKSSLEITAIDYANYALLYEQFAVNLILNYYRTDKKRNCELVFDDKTWSVNLLNNQIIENGQTVFSSPKTVTDTYFEQMRYFIDCLQSNRLPMNSVSEAVEVLKITLSE